MKPELQLLFGSCGLWIIYHGLERLKRTDHSSIGRYVYGMFIVPCLITAAFIVLAALNMLVDSILVRAGGH